MSVSYSDVKARLLAKAAPVLPPRSVNDPEISSLYVHPTLEAALHLLNEDLPSAHFLLRKMQAPPRYDAMFLHGILHRIEGDFENARAWYRNVADSDVFRQTWASLDKAMVFLQQIQDREDIQRLQEESKREISEVLRYCERTHGTQIMQDASHVWIQDEQSSAKGKDMVVGGEGWRQF